MGLTSQEIATIVAALQESDWDEAVVVVGDARIAVARNGARLGGDGVTSPTPASSPLVSPLPSVAAPAPAVPSVPAASEPASVADVTPPAPAAGTTITAPSVGVFWSSPEPGAAPFVAVGDRVAAGDTVCIVEVMKLMTNVTSKVTGTITAVLVGNGEDVEFGTPLFSVRED